VQLPEDTSFTLWPYRPALGNNEALDEIIKNKGIFYDAGVVDACTELFKKDNFKISDG
jgi:HD-GYP domain-containing protein (c-di-GMP phosphodiesterase class II)